MRATGVLGPGKSFLRIFLSSSCSSITFIDSLNLEHSLVGIVGQFLSRQESHYEFEKI